MNNSQFAVNVQPGDLILVNYSNGLQKAVYAGEGSKGNPNFWVFNKAWLDYLTKDVNAKLHKAYINRDYSINIVKPDWNSVGNDVKDEYQAMVQILKTKNKLP